MQTPGWKDIVGRDEDDVSSNSGRTEDSLISSRTSRETMNSTKIRKQSIAKYCQHKVRRHCYKDVTVGIRYRCTSKNCKASITVGHGEKTILHEAVEHNHEIIGQYKLLISSLFLSVFGVFQVIFPPYDILLSLRVRMTPGLPPFDWWFDPPDEVVAKVYVFNVTNSERFLNGTDKKIKLQELGPIIYREKLRHSNPVFNENGTLTYTANRTLIYLPDRNPVYLLNQTITMPNIAVLFIPSYLYDAPFFVRLGVNLMIRRLHSEMFKTATIEEFLWNMTDPILDVSHNIAPSLVPQKNVGILSRIYQNLVDNVTVYIGPKFDQRDFFKINNIDGSEYIPSGRTTCDDKVEGSSEGVTYFQHVNKNDTLRYFRKTFCGIAELKYAREIEKFGLKAYSYEMDPNFYDRKELPEEDCYKGQPVLLNGLRDVSSCNFGTAVAASNPHFLHGDLNLLNAVEGLNPDPKLHTSFAQIEPTTGVPLEGHAKSQLNIVIKDMMGFTEKLHKFSNLNIPLVWIQYSQEGIPPKIQWLLYFQVVLLPVLQKVFLVSTFVLSFVLFVLFLMRRKKCRSNLEKNKTLAFEVQKFLKQ